jgi:uncharacterized protein (DUF2236 family)
MTTALLRSIPMITRPIDAFRDTIARTASGLFKHARYPLANTLAYPGDPGLCGPDSVSWRVVGDPSAFFGGVRALLVQAAHPEVAAGVADHSRYREDPLGRLSRTSAYVTATTFGAMPEVDHAIHIVRRAHRPVAGTSHRSIPYTADAPDLAAWVHNALTDSLLEAYLQFGPDPLTPDQQDRFVAEQAQIGRLLGADPIPETAPDLRRWISDHPALEPSPGMRETVEFVRSPPLPLSVRPGYRLIVTAAAATIPPETARLLGIRRTPGAVRTGVATSSFLRWSLGSSPTWELSLLRCGAPIPPGRFRQPLPIPIEA